MSDIFPRGSVRQGAGDGLASSGVRRGALAPLASWVVEDNFLRYAQKCPEPPMLAPLLSPLPYADCARVRKRGPQGEAKVKTLRFGPLDVWPNRI